MINYTKRTHFAVRYSRATSNPWISSGMTQSSAVRAAVRPCEYTNAILDVSIEY